MAHHSKFLSVNLNKSYGKPPPPSTSSSSPGYVNGHPRSAGGGGGMVVLSRPRSSSGATAHKPTPRLAVPPPVNLPSLRKEHAHLDPALSKPSSGHGGSGLGIGSSSSMSWTKPTLPMEDFCDKNGGLKIPSAVEQRSFSSRSQPHGLTEKTVILRGEDFPSLMASSTYVSEQKQKQVNEKSNGLVEKSELSSVVDMSPKLRSSPPTKKIVQGIDGGSSRVLGSLEQSRQGGGKFPGPLPLVRLRHTSDWDDDERERNRVDHYEGRVFPDSEAHSSLSRDSGRGDSYGKEFMVFRKEDRNFSSWRAPDAPNREILSSRALHVVKDHFGSKNSVLSKGTGKESNHDRVSYGGRKEFSSGMGNGNAGVTEVEVSNNWQKGKPNTYSKGIIPLRFKVVSTNDPVQNFTKEKLMSNAGRYYAEDASWGGKETFSSDAMLDFKANVLRKKKEAVKHTDIFDPARESFEAELERVQWIQEQERQRVMEEQARVAEVARREAEERDRIARVEEERRQLIEREAREAAWRAEQEKLEAARRAEELRIAREEEKKKTLIEEERRKEAARQKLLELEARIASRQAEANVNDRMNENFFSRNSDVEHLTNSSSFDSSSVNRLYDSGSRSHTSSVENHSFVQLGKKENNWNNTNNSIVKFQDQDSDYLTAQKDGFCSSRSFRGKQFQGIHGPKPVTPSFKRGGMPGDQAQYGHSWDRNRDCDRFNGRSNINAMIGGWDLNHFDGSKLDSYTERSFQNSDVDDLASFSRVRRTIRQPRVPPPPSVSSSILKNPCGDASVGPNSLLSVHGDVEINQTGREEESDVQIVYGCSYHQRIIEPGVEPRMPEVMEESTRSLLQTEENNSPRYDSQSSLSISNPPSSPTQLSHDEFDDCGGSPPATAYAEEENMTFSEGKSMIPELKAVKNDGIIPFSHGVDEDWAIVDNEKLQEEEDHDEAFDSNQEDNEVHESDAWELQMKNKLKDLNVVVEKLMEIGHAAHGIENHVQLRTSDHYRFNKDSEYHEKTSTNAGRVSDSTSEHIFAVNSAGSLQSGETIPDEILNASSETVEEIAKDQEDLIFSLVTAADHPTDGVRASKNSGQNPIAAVSRLPLPSTSSLCSISASVPTSSGQNDMPAKLQFGLFSSPPLIPSPFPTIQIGSIQTPLFLNAQTDSYTYMHPPHPPLLQFGQIAYSPATSQSVLPVAAQTLSCTHHSPLDLHLVNGNTGSSSKNQVSRDSTTTKGLDKGQSSSSADVHSACIIGITNPSQSNLASDEKKDLHNLISHSGNPDAILNKNFRFMGYSKRNRGRPHVGSFSSSRKSLAGLKAPGTISDIRGNRLTYNVRNAGSVSSFTRTETSYVNSNRPQRRVRRHIQGTEYRVKESGARQMQCTESFSHSSYSGKPNSGNNLVLLGNMGKKGGVINKSAKLMNEEAAFSGSQVVGTDGNTGRNNRKETLHTSIPASRKFHGGEGNLNFNEHLGDDIDAPLLSGIVRVYNQPGIEASSDGDGFVEVRSKRKISNERRGQRERETNPKHKATKRVPHRHCATLSNNGTAYKSDMATTLTGGAAAKTLHFEPAIAHRKPSSDIEAAKLTTKRMPCQTITAIGSPDVNSADIDSKLNSLKSSHAGSDLAIANDEVNAESGLSFGKNIALDKVSVPLGTWGTIHLNLQSVASTQPQLDEASKPVQCNPVGATKVSSGDKKLETTCITKEDPSFSSLNLPNFPFDGEKIQFGAVVPPPLLPPSSQAAASSGIWSPGSLILNSSIIHSLPVNNHGERNYFDKEKYHSESCTGLDDTEAEAEAAASAVAVAVITNDEMTASSIGTGSISGVGTKRLSCTGVTSCTNTTCQSASEVIVSLPSDLSVNTPLSLWPPLPTIRSSHPMLSDIVGPQPSHFPFFDSNPMLGGPILAFRPPEESTGAWPQCHSGVEPSFYGSPTGFSAPFMGSPTGLSGVHGRAPMVFYNHFAPIGQFGQVGLGYMGGAYLPTGKPPDWKHSSDGAATANASQADPSNINVVYGQQNAAHLPTSIQHLSTGSGVMQLTSPFTLFNLRPFQSSTEIPVPAQWPPIPHPHSPNSIRLSAVAPPEQLQISPPSDLPYSATAVNFPDELGLVESSTSIPINAQTIQSSRNHSTNIIYDSNGMMADKVRASSSSSSSSSSSPLQKMMSSGSQHGRRSTFHGKYGSNKSNSNIGSSKMKQIYVAKSVLNSPGGVSG